MLKEAISYIKFLYGTKTFHAGIIMQIKPNKHVIKQIKPNEHVIKQAVEREKFYA